MREATAAAPIAGAVVSLLDSAGHTVARTLSSADGRYWLAGNGTGAVIRAVHIGFRPSSGAILRGDSDVVADVRMTLLPAVLDAVEVHDQQLCPASANAPAAFALWEQARTALLAGIVSREVNPPVIRMLSYTRALDAKGTHVEDQDVSDSIYTASQPIVSARTAAEFAARGYRDVGADKYHYRFHAPDADVLLDSMFVRGHCLSLRESDAEHPDAAGIAFDPIKRRDSIIDIAGVLWLNRSVPGLRSLTFRFTNVKEGEMGDGASGDLVFTEMPTGVAMITRWNLHMPIAQATRVQLGGTVMTFRVSTRVVAYEDAGGELAQALWHDGTSWVGPLATIGGHVLAFGGKPVAGIPVRLRGSPTYTKTDSTGAFKFPPTVPGPYVVEVSDPVMAEVGVTLEASAKLVVDRSPVDTVRIAMPSRKPAIAALCEKEKAPKSRDAGGYALLIGHVRLAGGAPAATASIRSEWKGSFDFGAQTVQLSARSDSAGVFRICGPSAAVAVVVGAARDSLVSKNDSVAVDSAAGTAQVTLVVATPAGGDRTAHPARGSQRR